MSVNYHTCITVECDQCGADGDDGGEGYTPHFPGLTEAREHFDTWVIRNDARVLCGSCSEEDLPKIVHVEGQLQWSDLLQEPVDANGNVVIDVPGNANLTFPDSPEPHTHTCGPNL